MATGNLNALKREEFLRYVWKEFFPAILIFLVAFATYATGWGKDPNTTAAILAMVGVLVVIGLVGASKLLPKDAVKCSECLETRSLKEVKKLRREIRCSTCHHEIG